jgi:hypothetical protein
MKQTEQATVTVDLQMWHVERIWTEFRNDPNNRDVATVLNAARQDAYQRDKQQAPDSAKIPVTVRLTASQARAVLDAFMPWVEGQSDREVYTLVKNALVATE